MFRRTKVNKTRRSAIGARLGQTVRRKTLIEVLEERYLFSAASIVAENALPGTPASVWDIDGAGSANIQGYAAKFSVDVGDVEQFKVDTDARSYHLDIYRLGYYQGLGARYITTVQPSAALPQNQPDAITDYNTGLVDAGNWKVSASWNVPANAVSGVYIAKLVRDDGTFGESHIIFVVRDDSSTSDIVFKTADATWQAYNDWGGSSLYGNDLGAAGRSYEVSYNRPFTTRDRIAANFYFGAEYSMSRYLEQNGYDVTYVGSMDLDRNPSLLLNHKMFISAGHDEYWSGDERDAVTNARDAGVSLAFFSGNEMFWKTYWGNSIDGSNTPYTTLVCYKSTHDNALTDPTNPDIWTGTWRDPRFSPPADGGRPENAVTGTLFTVNGDGSIGTSITVPAANASLRFWRNTSVAKLTGNQTATLGQYVLGYEWDEDIDNGFRPAGLFGLSSTTVNVSAYIQDYGSNYAPGTATHSLTMYRAASGALVFGAGTIQYSWGLDTYHDGPSTTVDKNMQQATVNLFADMGVQPASLMSGLVRATMSTDHTGPTSVLTSLANNAVLQPGVAVTLRGTASDSGGGVIAGVEVSVDGGATWHPATGRASWTYVFTPRSTGEFTIVVRAIDDSGNIEVPTTTTRVNPNTNPGVFSFWGSTTAPGTADGGDGQAATLGVQFRTDVDGFITGIKFYKSGSNTGTHVGSLWSATGQLLATATFTNETSSGWQTVNFSTPVQVQAGQTYVASYYAPNGHYSVDRSYFAKLGVDNGPLHAVAQGSLGANGVYIYGNNQFPTQTYQSTNYWVDVVFNTQMKLDTTPPVVQSMDAAGGSTTITTDSSIVIKFNEPLAANSITSNTVQLVNPATTSLPAGCCGTPSGWCSGCPLQLGVKTTVITASLAYDPINATVTITPTSPLNTSSIYTVMVKGGAGGVTDAAGNPLAADTARSFFTPAQAATVWSSVWSTSTVPATVDSGDGQGIELGMKFTPTTSGSVAGVEFYKAAGNTGTHTGSLWSSSGQLLATATFSSETASGWQQVTFSNPVAVTAGTTYVVSYHTNVGHYSVSRSYFTSAYTSGQIQVPANGGVYLYGSGMPTQSYQGSNYWVDVILRTPPPADNIAPTVVGFTPATGTTNVSTSAAATVTFSEAIDPASLSSMTLKLLDSGNHAVPTVITYDTATKTATLTPTAPLAAGSTHTIVVVGGIAGVKDAAGNSVVSAVSSSFVTAGPAVPDTTPPTVISYSPATGATGVPVGNSVVVTFSEPMNAATLSTSTVLILKNGVNRVAESVVYDPTTRSVTITPDAPLLGSTSYSIYLVGGVTGIKDANGNALADTLSTFTTGAADTTPPTVVTVSPAAGATSVAVNASITVTFSESVSAASITTATVRLLDGANVVTATVSYNAATNSVTLTPSAPLSNSKVYTVSVLGGSTGVKDASGNALAASFSSSFTTAAPADTTAPTVTSFNPANGASSVATSATVSVTFSEAMDPATINGTTVSLRTGTNAVVPATVTYNAATNTVTLTPTSALSSSSTYNIIVQGGASGVKDVAGNPLAANATSLFLTSTVLGSGAGSTSTLWASTTTPTTADSGDGQGAELGVKFTANTNGYITGIRYYKSAANTGTHTGSLWSSAGKLLATATFTGEGGSGWQQVLFSTPIAVTAGTTYVASYHTTSGHYAVNRSYFSSAFSSGSLQVPASGGVYIYGNSAFPTQSYQASNYWVDVVLNTAPPADTTPPTVTAFSPTNGTTGVVTSASLAVTFSEAMAATTISSSTLVLRNASNTVIPATVTYNATTKVATITPTNALAAGTTYSITVVSGSSGVKDSAGNALATNAVSSFTTLVVDATPPVVIVVSPANGASNVATSATMSVTFSEAMNAATITSSTIVLRNSANTVIPATVTYNAATATATVTPTSALSAGTTYSLTIVAGASGVKDVAGNALAVNAVTSFATVAADTTPPVVNSVSPANGAVNIATSAAITVTFNEAMNAATITSSTLVLRNAANTVIPVTVTYNAGTATATVTPTGALAAGTKYTLTITAGSSGVKDAAGNALATNAVTSFTTVAADTTAPVVTLINPANGTTSVATSAAITVTFSEAMTAATITNSTLVLRNASNTVIAATVTYNSANNTATITPTSALASGTTYTVTITAGASGVKDLAGNALATNAVSTFTTAAAAPVTASLWPSTTTPSTVDSGDGQAIELGVKFTANSSGYITGIRYYKSAANTGTHTGSLWSSTGKLLATATFTGEGGSGWQQVIFSTPVAVTAGTTYVASYHTNTGHYSANRSYFSSSYTSGPLTVPANGGVYSYGAGSFPSASYQSTNYWVDVVFSSTPPVDTTAPTITSISPANGASSVPVNSSVTVAFSEAMNAATISSSTLVLKNASNVVVAATVTYNSGSNTATLTPTSTLANNTTYTVTVTGGVSGVKDVAGNVLAAASTATFTTAAQQAATSSLWSASTTPATVDSGDGQAIELGTKFTATTSGYITGIRFYKSAANTGTHTASLWSASGQLLATGTFVNETSSGWQQVLFSTPVAITAGTTYVASYHTNSGHYSVNRSYFGSAFSSGSLQAPANAGVYLYGAGGFPTQTYQASNYWVDVLFSPIGG